MPPRLRLVFPPGGAGDLPLRVKPPGSLIRQGQSLLAIAGESGPDLLSPASGRILGIGQATLTNGRDALAVEVEVQSDSPISAAPPELFAPPASPPPSERPLQTLGQLLDQLRGGGLWADRIACPDLLGQFNDALRRPVDVVLANLLDGDFPVSFNGLLARRSSGLLLAGLLPLARVLRARVVLAVEESATPGAWSALDRRAREAGALLVALPPRYPLNDPTLLLHSLLRRKLRPGRRPTEQGVLMLDAPAALAVGSVLRGQPPLQLPFALYDHTTARAHYLMVPLGASLRDVLRQLDLPEGAGRLLGGDALRRQPLSWQTVVGGSELIAHRLPPSRPLVPAPCIRCGDCARVCPTRLQPAGILEAAQHHDAALARWHGVEGCVQCGLCQGVCPSALPLVQAARTFNCRHDHPDAA